MKENVKEENEMFDKLKVKINKRGKQMFLKIIRRYNMKKFVGDNVKKGAAKFDIHGTLINNLGYKNMLTIKNKLFGGIK